LNDEKTRAIRLLRWEEVVEWCEKSVATDPPFFQPYFELVVAYAWLGRDADPSAALAKLQEIKLGVSAQTYLDFKYSDDPTWKKEQQRIAVGDRKAALPER
jgi:hypothetical protein